MRGPAQEFAINFSRHAFPILWMKQSVRVSGLPLLKSKTVIIERGLVVIQTPSVWSQDGDVLMRKIKELSELLFALPDFRLGLYEITLHAWSYHFTDDLGD